MFNFMFNDKTIKHKKDIYHSLSHFGIKSISQTNVSGGIFANTTWTLANSPYIITNNIVVFPAVTLNVQPSVEIRVKGTNSGSLGYYIEARGVINMIGNASNKITVRTDTTIDSLSAWQGFIIKTAQGGALNYDYVKFSNANYLFNYDLSSPNTLNLHNSEFNSSNVNPSLIKNSRFISNATAINNPSNGVIDSCTFKFNDKGIEAALNMQIKNSILDSNNLALQAGYGSTAMKNKIVNNQIGVALGPVSVGQIAPNVIDNRICLNGFNIDNRTDLNLFIPTNCFCESDSTIIESKILDGYDDVSKGLISYGIFDTICTTVLKIVNKAPINLSINENKNATFRFYPNPVKDFLRFSNENNFESLEVTDIQGSLVKKIALKTGQNQHDLSELNKGIYFVRLSSNDGKTSFYKLVKE
jgi:hypothetical protein